MTAFEAAVPSLRLQRPHDPELLIFIRHGQTAWNAEGRMQGHRDIPLNATGRGQATANGERLKAFFQRENLIPDRFDFVASPLDRASTTMRLVRGAMGLDQDAFRQEDRLKEVTFGAWEGFTFEDLADEEQELVARRRADRWRFVPPQGESYEMLSERIGDWLRTVQRPTVTVAHGGVFRVLRGLLEERVSAEVPKLEVPQDKVFVWRDGRFETV